MIVTAKLSEDAKLTEEQLKELEEIPYHVR
jgi:hypothetical protein